MIETIDQAIDFPAIPQDAVVLGTVPSPAGDFGAAFTAAGLAYLSLPPRGLDRGAAWVQRWAPAARIIPEHPALDALAAQLTAYFEGSLREFTVPLDLRGTTFQQDVWRALQAIPYGEMRTYGEIAVSIGRPRAVRAVGMANHDNPVPIIIPCHRVIGSNRRLTGYGGGLDLKARLLRLEGALPAGADA